MRVLSVVGARPQFVKLAPVARALEEQGCDHIIVHTGQHYDPSLSEIFFSGFALPSPEINLRVGSSSQAVQTAEMLRLLEPELRRVEPDWVMVYGDTNSTLAAAIAAAKLGLPIAHLEAGLRSFNRTMPEEHNRVLTDHCADLLLAPSDLAYRNLQAEGLGGRSLVVGDVMVDILLAVVARLDQESAAAQMRAEDPFLLATLHRPYNTDSPERLGSIIAALNDSPIPVILPAHPRLLAKTAEFSIAMETGSVKVVTPMPYAQLVESVRQARAVITDSGGLQKEAYVLGIPCTTVRPETEWTETLEGGWNELRFSDVSQIIPSALRPVPSQPRALPYGSGGAAKAVVEALCRASRQAL